jgi:hypothetical protein
MAIKKTMHELAKEFPNKTYRELEKYRDADRNEEAQRIFTQQENEELKEDQHKDRTIFDEERKKFQDYKEMYEKEHELRQKAEKELADLKKKTDPVPTLQKARESGL